jgi:hypothetical protein
MSITDIQAPPSDEKPDWFLNSVNGKLPQDLNKLRETGVYAGNFNILPKEDYWALDEVKGMFTDKEGKQHKDKFDEYYKQTDGVFKNNLEFERYNLVNDDGYASEYAKRLGNIGTLPYVRTSTPDPNGRFYNSNARPSEKFGAKAYGAKEVAVANDKVLMPDGQEITVNDWEDEHQGFWTGTLKFAKGKNGEYLLDENNNNYFVPVGDGEKLKATDELYSQYSDVLGRYGTGEGFWGGLGGVTTSLIKAPTNVATATINSLLTSLEVIADVAGFEGGAFEKNIVNLRNRVNSNTIGYSENAVEDWLSPENLVGMTADGVMQLIQIVATGGLLKMVGAPALAARWLPLLNMGMLQSGHVYDMAREGGFSAREAGTIYGFSVAAFTALATLDDKIIRSFMGAAPFSSASIGPWMKSLNITSKGGFTKAGMLATAKNWRQIVPKLAGGIARGGNLAAKSATGRAIGSGVREGLQEWSEQAYETGTKYMSNIYSEMMYEGAEDRPSFAFDMDKEIQSWKQAALGGVLTGSVAPFVMRRMYGVNEAPADEMTQFVREIVNGNSEKIYKIIDRLHAEQRLAPSWENADGQYISEPTGESQENLTDAEKAERDKKGNAQINASKNDIAATILRQNVAALEELVESKGFKNFATNQKVKFAGELQQMTNLDALKIATGLIEKNDYVIDGKTLYDKYTTSGRDAAKLVSHINKLDGDLESYKKGDADNVLIEQTIKQKKELQAKLDAIKSGKNTKDYVAEGLYNMMSFTKGRGTLNLAEPLSAITGKSFISLNNGVRTDTAKIKELATKEFNKQQEIDSAATLKSEVEELSGISAEKKQELLTEASDNTSLSGEALIKVFEAPEGTDPQAMVCLV